jgi:hypothetical protein
MTDLSSDIWMSSSLLKSKLERFKPSSACNSTQRKSTLRSTKLSTSNSQSQSQFRKRNKVKVKRVRSNKSNHLQKKRKRRNNPYSRLKIKSGLSLTESQRTFLNYSCSQRVLQQDMM